MAPAGSPRNLMIAAGGGGDAIAAAILGAVLPGHTIGIATYSWDRLIIDPLPGPRPATDFTGLDTKPGYHQVTPSTTPKPPAGSTLPRLAAEIGVPLILLDPTEGAAGLRRQLTAASTDLRATATHVIDVGGDVLARPGDTGLRSPLADALAVAAARGLAATVWIAGPGLDGELSEATVMSRIPHDAVALPLDDRAWQPYRPILDWHPSEASALLAACAYGARGSVEIRDAGIPVALTDTSQYCFGVPIEHVAAVNPLIDALAHTTTLGDAEAITRTVIGICELDAERAKANRRTAAQPAEIPDFDTALRRWQHQAAKRGIRYVTYRRLTEALHQTDIDAVRSRLAPTAPDPQLPLWDITAAIPPTGISAEL